MRRFLCAGLNRHEAENAKFLRERISDPLGPETAWRCKTPRFAVTAVLDLSSGLAVARLGTLIAFVCVFGVEFNDSITGTVYAVDLETNSAFLYIADILVSGSVCFSPSFEHDRCVEMHGLCGRAFIFPESDFRTAEQEVRSSIYFSVSTSFF
jgi:hypothetical protein